MSERVHTAFAHTFLRWPLLCAVNLLPFTALADGAPLRGLSVAEAVHLLENDGLTIFYSSDLIKPDMRVVEEPEAQDARARLDAILAPFGLATRDGPRRSLLIVRVAEPATARAAPPTARALPFRNSGAAPASAEPGIDEIVVGASRYALGRAVESSKSTLDADNLQNLPGIGDDPLRAAGRLPGMATTGLSARTHVRGGNIDETLIRLDGLRLYNPYHFASFQGVFSTVDPRTVSAIDIYSGAFPAVFGDRTSGVTDIASMAAPADRHYEVGVSFFNTSVLGAAIEAMSVNGSVRSAAATSTCSTRVFPITPNDRATSTVSPRFPIRSASGCGSRGTCSI
jgi:hypothetical protein